MQNIIENNKLIAEFMGAKVKLIDNQYYFYDWKNKLCSITPTTWNNTPEETLNRIWEIALKKDGRLGQFHKDWNWLMEVVEKIETISEFNRLPEFFIMYDNREEFKGWYWSIEIPKKFNKECYKHNNREKTKIEAVYNACVEFIKWYNENK